MRLMLTAATAMALVVAAGPSLAASATGSFQVSMTVTAQCSVTSANSLNFGSTGVWSSAVDGSSIFQVQCTNSTPYQVGLDLGANASGATRRMMSGASFITYQLYTNAGRTTVWGDTIGTDTLQGQTGNGANQTLTIYGRVPVQTVPPASTYTDTVTITVTY